MRKNEFVKEMREFEKLYENINKNIDDLFKVGFNLESDIFECLYHTSNYCLRLIAEKYDLNEDGLFWFVIENRFGKGEMVCGYEGKNYVIDSIESFWKFERLNIK